MPRRHRAERRRRIVAAAAVVLVAAGCSGSSDRAERPAPTPSTLAATTPPTAPPMVPPTITTTPVRGPTGVVATVTTVSGDGTATVALPASVGRPAIVHARYTGVASFVVRALDANGRRVAVLATSLGHYDGTFPVGFVERAGHAPTRLRVTTTGTWQLDIAKPVLAPRLAGGGTAGRGDAVLAYDGPAAVARFAYHGASTVLVDIYSRGRLTILVSAVGPRTSQIALPAGPAFVSVTAAGEWSISLGRRKAR